jgi:hypothetical protein
LLNFFKIIKLYFFSIPKFGDTNSHEYLIKTSSEYIGSTNLNDDLIQALLEETNQLRQENLELQQSILGNITQ